VTAKEKYKLGDRVVRSAHYYQNTRKAGPPTSANGTIVGFGSGNVIYVRPDSAKNSKPFHMEYWELAPSPAQPAEAK
jgi:hypothetical protein